MKIKNINGDGRTGGGVGGGEVPLNKSSTTVCVYNSMSFMCIYIYYVHVYISTIEFPHMVSWIGDC